MEKNNTLFVFNSQKLPPEGAYAQIKNMGESTGIHQYALNLVESKHFTNYFENISLIRCQRPITINYNKSTQGLIRASPSEIFKIHCVNKIMSRNF